MTWRRWCRVVAPALVLAAGCDRELPTSTASRPEPATVGFEIVDAAHAAGQPGFYFLPPMVAAPTYAGTFDPALAPTVKVCSLVPATAPATGFVCGTTFKEFSGTKGAAAVTVDLEGQSYNALWNTKKGTPVPTTGPDVYRLEVSVGSVLLGYADLWFVGSSKEMKTVTPGYVGGVVGSTMRIKFRIETGIVGQVVVSPATATVTVGATQQFTAALKDLHGADLTGPDVTWSTSDVGVATISATGLATGAGAGAATITATSQRATGTATLTVQSAGPHWALVTHSLGTSGALGGVWGSSASDVFAVNSYGVVGHFDGASWTSTSVGAGLQRVWGTSGSDVFAVGGGGIKHFNGSSWSSMTIPSAVGWLNGVWGRSSTEVYAAGENNLNAGILLRYDGSTWTIDYPGTVSQLAGVWGASNGELYAVGVKSAGSVGVVMHNAYGSWLTYYTGTLGTQLHAVWGTSATDVFAVGDNGTIVHCTVGCLPMSSSTSEDLYGVWGLAANDVYAVGTNGAIVHYNGTSWSTVTHGLTTALLRDVWGSSATDIYVVGSSNTILHYAQ